MRMRSYTLLVGFAGDHGEIDAAMKAATGWIAENLDPGGNHDLVIHLQRDAGDVLASYVYEAPPDTPTSAQDVEVTAGTLEVGDAIVTRQQLVVDRLGRDAEGHVLIWCDGDSDPMVYDESGVLTVER